MKNFIRVFSTLLILGISVTVVMAQSGVNPKAALNGTAKGTHHQLFDASPYSKLSPTSGEKALFDVIFSFPVAVPPGLATGVETDGQYIYTCVWNSAYFYRYTMAGALVDSFTITGVSSIRDLAYDGQYFYGSSANNLIRKMDFTAHTLVATITAPVSVVARHIAYDSDNDAFWCGDWDDDFSLVNQSGTVIQTIPASTHLQTASYGSAYDPYSPGGPYLWIYNQDSPSLNNLVQISIATGAPTGVTLDLSTKITYPSGAIAGGCFISEDVIPNIAVIGGCVQNEVIWGLEMINLAVYANDVSPVELVYPTSADTLTASDSLTVTVENLDTADHWNIPISYVIDGGPPVNDTIFDTIDSQGSLDFTFQQPADFSIPGHVYNVMIYTALAGDLQPSNDTLITTLTNFWDVQPLSIDMPPIVGPGSLNPLATVQNNGTLTTTFDVTMEIQGGYTDTQTVSDLDPGATAQVTFAAWNATIGTYDITVYTTLAPDSVPANDTLDGDIQVMNLTKVFAYNAYDPSLVVPEGPIITYIQAPGTITSLADQTGTNFISGATWTYGNLWLGAAYGENNLVRIDTTTGDRTIFGQMGIGVAGLAFDHNNHILYGVDWDGVNSNLYSINMFNGSATLIGTCTSELLINLACDINGKLFSAAITDDNLYSIDPLTGAGTVIGPLGFDAAYAQDMEFDQYSGNLYMAAYNSATGGEVRLVDTATGGTSLIGSFAGDAEITGLAIPYHLPVPANDLVAVNINNLASACDLSATTPIEVTVFNVGTANVTGFDITYVVNGGTPVTQTVSTTITPGSFYDFTFTTTADLSAIGTYDITVFVTLAGDTMQWNDTTFFSVEQVAPSVVPYAMGFEPTENFDTWKIVDVNDDGFTWYLSTTGGNTDPYCMKYSYTTANAANDWLITTCFDLDATRNYRISYFYQVESATYPESFMVHMGTTPTPAGLSTMLSNHPNLTNETYVQGNDNFTVPTTGIYYFGFHCNSDADMWNLYLDDVTITDVTGIRETEEGNVSIYPNPANDVLNIVSGSTVKSICITNTIGDLLYSTMENGKFFSLNTSEFAPGMYFITLVTEEGTTTQKLMIE